MKQWVIAIGTICGLTLGGASVARAGTDDFTITKYDVQMKLRRDGENRSVLEATETITANFPETDQNHGLQKIFVNEYDGHSTRLTVTSVTDESGRKLKYSMDGNAMRIGDADTYVHGLNTYKITYTQRDVTRLYGDTNRDEFYWDIIGTEWRVPIQQATIQLEIDSSLVASRQGDAQCYMGVSGSTERCTVTPTGTRYNTTVANIGNGGGVTMALGFTPHTFAQYQKSFVEKAVDVLGMIQAAATAVVAAVIGFVIVRYNRLVNRSRELEPIPVEYIPPKDMSVTAASGLVTPTGNIMAAQLIDLAVRRYLKLYQTKEKSFFSTGDYEIEVAKSIADLKAEERELLTDMYGHEPTVGERLDMKTLANNMSYSTRTIDNDGKLDKLIKGEYELKEPAPDLQSWLKKVAAIALICGVFMLSIPFLVLAFIIFLMSLSVYRLSDKGLETKRYILGLKEYIGLAEAERLQMLQSPEGAEKTGAVDVNDPAQLVKLYERNLPYAVFFGQEKEWSKQLGVYYEKIGTSPDWYSGNGAFNAVMFADGMNSLGSVASTASSYSSSSGGSSGGGSSGGGGGGGGGGGW